MNRLSALLAASALIAAPPAAAQAQGQLQERVEAVLKEAGPGVRFGLVLAAEDGTELVAINPEQRFIPASNTKMFTTAAAYHRMPDLTAPDAAGGASVRLEPGAAGVPDVILKGHGDARLSAAPDCTENCLATLADAVAAQTRRVGAVIGDDSLFPDQRWSYGMSWNNIPSRSGTAISALTLDNNEIHMRAIPGAIGAPPRLEVLPYYEVDNRAVTVATGKTDLSFDRLPGSFVIRLHGTILADAQPELVRMGIDDPAHYTAWRFKRMLEERGVRVAGEVNARHRLPRPADDPKVRNGAPPPRPPEPAPLARLTPPPLAQDLAQINKSSQNLHSDLMLRRIGLLRGTGSVADGVEEIRAMLTEAGVPRTGYDFSDGSGMSTYNRVAPRSMVTFLRWIGSQSWAEPYRSTLPIGGVDGTLSQRFKDTPLQGRLFAKTGTLNATNGLSGWMTTKSGRTLIFSAYANDVPDGVSATPFMDRALALIAAEN